MSSAPFGTRLFHAMAEHGPLCVGIDPHAELLAAWGLSDDAAGLRTFSLTVIDALAGHVAAVKPQSAFFERHASAGVAVLEEVIAACRARGVLCVLDAKRGDIGSTMDGYAQAYLTEGSPLAADAVTLSPYLGFGSLSEALHTALANDRGAFVLALTSNKEGEQVQHTRDAEGIAVAARIASEAAALNAPLVDAGAPLGSIGLVVGATVGTAPADLGVDLDGLAGPILTPGVGAQGGRAQDLARTFGAALPAVLASSSRGVLRAGPDPADLVRAAASANAELRTTNI